MSISVDIPCLDDFDAFVLGAYHAAHSQAAPSSVTVNPAELELATIAKSLFEQYLTGLTQDISGIIEASK
jgi:hypothetical protein